jgi:transcriptional regulator with XRE-family HTH domain
MTLGSRIAAWRKARGFSQGRLADAVEVTRAAVSQWEDNQTSPSQAHLAAVVKKFGLTMEQFYGPLPKRERAAS